MKKVTILLLIAALLMASLIACSNTKEGPSGDKSEAPEASGTVEVYYVKNLFKDMLKEAIDLSQFGDSIKVNITAFETFDELDEAIQKDGMPDLLLLDGFYEGFGEQFNIRELVNLAEPLDAYLEADESYDSENYLGGVMEAGQVAGKQYILPLSVQTEYLLVSDAHIAMSELATLPEKYELSMLTEAIQAEAAKHVAQQDYWTVMPNSHYVHYSDGSYLESFLVGNGYLQLDYEKGSYQLEEAAFKEGVDFVRFCNIEANRGYESGSALSGSLFSDAEAMRLIQTSNKHLLTEVKLYMDVYRELSEETMKVLTYPYWNAGAESGVMVNSMAMIGADSENKKAAYAVARALMDIPARKWINLGSDTGAQWFTSVNRKVLEEEIELLKDSNVTTLQYGDATIKQESLTEELATSLLEWTSSIKHAALMDAELSTLLEASFGAYINGESDDYNAAFSKFTAALEAYLAA